MLVATTERVAGQRVTQTLGQVFGVVVRSRGLGGNILASLRSIAGGEIHEYTQLLEETCRQAVDRLVRNATAMGANAVIMMRFDSSEIGQYMS
ncbi:MAG: heavy metal-binding domain-containing protein, partial [Rhizomicrobium sp.]